MRFAIVDLECTSLKSDQGFLLCGGIKELGKRGTVTGLHDAGFSQGRLHIDHKLALALRDKIETFDGVITWNGKMFDWPFLNDRLMLNGEDPVEKRFHIDIMYQARQGRARLTSSRLDWVSKIMRVKSRKTDLDLNTWKCAEAEALAHFANGRENYDYIVKHCEADLAVTEQVYENLKNRVQNIVKT
jgi:uncharacterized protein YprB with RNaseH-like and TPR domain